MNNDNKLIEKSKEIDLQNQVLMPAVSPDEALRVWKQYKDLKEKIIEPSDIQKIEGKDFLKKSYWRKIATFFNLSVEVISESHEQVGRTIVWHFTCKAIASKGRFAIGVGSCDAYEKATLKDGRYMGYNKNTKSWYEAKANSIHNIRATAETRAFNRAVSNLVGGGEVSAEEVEAVSTPIESGSINGKDEEKIDIDEVDKALKDKI